MGSLNTDNVWIIKTGQSKLDGNSTYTVLDSDSSYKDGLGWVLLVIHPTNDYHCVG